MDVGSWAEQERARADDRSYQSDAGKIEPLELPGPAADVWHAAFSPDNRWFILRHGGGRVRLYDLEDGARAADLLTSDSLIESFAFSPDSRSVAVSGAMPEVYVCTLEPPAVRHTLRVSGGDALAVKFSPDGNGRAAGAATGWSRRAAGRAAGERPRRRCRCVARLPTSAGADVFAADRHADRLRHGIDLPGVAVRRQSAARSRLVLGYATRSSTSRFPRPPLARHCLRRGCRGRWWATTAPSSWRRSPSPGMDPRSWGRMARIARTWRSA
ncbi:MAG: WD40 repeat domain-containing protein [Verrucomicrobiales bacterium]